MAINNKDDITLGLGTLEFGDYVDEVFDSYEDVGAIKTEVILAHNREVLDFESGRPLVVIKQEVIRESVMVTATLAEITVGALKQTLGQGSTSTSVRPTFLDGSSSIPTGTLETGRSTALSGDLLKFGGLPTHAFIGLRFTHRKSNGKRVVFEGFKASPMGELQLPFRETDWALRTCQFRLLADTDRPAGEQYYQLSIER